MSPTWSDVEPILRAECTSCHGGSAATTGGARGVVYRLDFYDLDPQTCGDATAAMEAARFAAAASSQIAFDITSESASIRPRMPPAPGPSLVEWEWQTLLRWADHPQKGPEPTGNRPPVIQVVTSNRLVTANSFNLSVVLEDPDGDSAMGVLTIGDVTLKMDRPGAFAVNIDASQWPAGPAQVQATVCDGWRQATYDLGSFAIGG